MAPKLNAEAMNLLSEIKAILDDDAVEDPACLHRIDAIVNAFWSKGIYTPRHDLVKKKERGMPCSFFLCKIFRNGA